MWRGMRSLPSDREVPLRGLASLGDGHRPALELQLDVLPGRPLHEVNPEHAGELLVGRAVERQEADGARCLSEHVRVRQPAEARDLLDLGEVRLNRDQGMRGDEALGEAARAIRDECDRLKICPVLFHQLGRLAEVEKVPRLGWLANSDVLGQAARTVGFLSLDGPADEELPGALRIHFVKGPPGKHVELQFQRRTMAVTERGEPAQRDLAV
jgi:hypothetical protein